MSFYIKCVSKLKTNYIMVVIFHVMRQNNVLKNVAFDTLKFQTEVIHVDFQIFLLVSV